MASNFSAIAGLAIIGVELLRQSRVGQLNRFQFRVGLDTQDFVVILKLTGESG